MPLQSKIINLPTELLFLTIGILLDDWEVVKKYGVGRNARNPLLTLALTCRRLERLACYLLYRDITLMDERSLERLTKCLRRRGGSRLETFTESLVIGVIPSRRWVDVDSFLLMEAAEILGACSNLRALALSEDFVPILGCSTALPGNRGRPRPLEITLLNLPVKGSSLNSTVMPHYNPTIISNLTHLTLAEPPETWTDPLMALLSLPLAPRTLQQLTLSRKEHSNVDNDDAFLFCVSTLLQMVDSAMDEDSDSDDLIYRSEARFARLEKVTIRIFPGYGAAEHDEDADIWSSARIMASKDPRVVIEKGYWGRWIDSWGRGRV